MKKFLPLLILVSSSITLAAQAPQKNIKAVTPAATTKTVTESGNTQLTGMFTGPAGTAIILQNNGKNDLAISIPAVNGKFYGTNNFKFPTPLPKDSKYKLSFKKMAAGQTCVIYAGPEGSMSQGYSQPKAGCDYTYDLMSRSITGVPFSTFYETADAAVGGYNGEEGRYITFVSSAAGFGGSTGKHRQIFWRDRNTGITKLISAGLAGEEGNGDSYAPAISGDGKWVAFESHSSNLVAEDKNGFRDVFVWHSATNKVFRISVGEGGKEADAESYEPSVSGDGSFIAFTSAASNISSTGKGVSNNNVFLRDMKLQRSIMISVDPSVSKGGGGSKPSINFDGTRIAFYSNTGSLVASDKNGLWDIFLWDKNNSGLKRVSMAAEGKERGQGSESANRIVSPAISGNGQYIAFTTTANDMVIGDNNNLQDVFVYDINSGKTVIASNGTDGKPGTADSPIEQGEKIAISFDGTWVAFSTRSTNLGVPAANIVMHNMTTGKNRPVSTVVGSSVGRPTISYTGAYVVFGIGGKLDSRFASSGIFANYTGIGPCHSCP